MSNLGAMPLQSRWWKWILHYWWFIGKNIQKCLAKYKNIQKCLAKSKNIQKWLTKSKNIQKLLHKIQKHQKTIENHTKTWQHLVHIHSSRCKTNINIVLTQWPFINRPHNPHPTNQKLSLKTRMHPSLPKQRQKWRFLWQENYVKLSNAWLIRE